MRNDIQWWLKNWEATCGFPEVSLYDFGDSTTVMPIAKDNSWLTTSICFVHVRGEGKPNIDNPKVDGITYLGGGWFFYGVEIPLGTTKDELYAKLDSAKAHLLAGVKDHGKQVDAAGV
jgi:hypothetical protein